MSWITFLEGQNYRSDVRSGTYSVVSSSQSIIISAWLNISVCMGSGRDNKMAAVTISLSSENFIAVRPVIRDCAYLACVFAIATVILFHGLARASFAAWWRFLVPGRYIIDR